MSYFSESRSSTTSDSRWPRMMASLFAVVGPAKFFNDLIVRDGAANPGRSGSFLADSSCGWRMS